jgi:hypothetical protein
MTKANDWLQPSTKPHPLEEVILKIFADWEKRGGTNLDLVHITLSMGACSHPKRGRDAYRTVAEDVLGYMTGQGKLVQGRYGTTPPNSRVRDGGYYWRRPKEVHEPATEFGKSTHAWSEKTETVK